MRSVKRQYAYQVVCDPVYRHQVDHVPHDINPHSRCPPGVLISSVQLISPILDQLMRHTTVEPRKTVHSLLVSVIEQRVPRPCFVFVMPLQSRSATAHTCCVKNVLFLSLRIKHKEEPISAVR